MIKNVINELFHLESDFFWFLHLNATNNAFFVVFECDIPQMYPKCLKCVQIHPNHTQHNSLALIIHKISHFALAVAFVAAQHSTGNFGEFTVHNLRS